MEIVTDKTPTSILQKKIDEPSRPYSQDELNTMILKTQRGIGVGKVWACHQKCKHIYLAKSKGKRERNILETKNPNIGGCSVCWKLGKTDKNLRIKANILVYDYMNIIKCQKEYPSDIILTYDDWQTIRDFYTWLYIEE